jgi:hypothetical protein
MFVWPVQWSWLGAFVILPLDGQKSRYVGSTGGRGGYFPCVGGPDYPNDSRANPAQIPDS